MPLRRRVQRDSQAEGEALVSTPLSRHWQKSIKSTFFGFFLGKLINSVDHVARRKPEARRDLRLPRLAAAKPGASLGERRPCGTVDGARSRRRRGPALCWRH